MGLARAIDLDVRLQQVAPLRQVTPATLLGKGVVTRIAAAVEEQGIGLVVVDDKLTPVQQRNLEKAWQAKVIDRTGLILEIFGARARTHEGRLQVELAFARSPEDATALGGVDDDAPAAAGAAA